MHTPVDPGRRTPRGATGRGCCRSHTAVVNQSPGLKLLVNRMQHTFETQTRIPGHGIDTQVRVIGCQLQK